VVARALAPHGGLLFYRGFVYDNHMDWQNPEERSRARRLRQFPRSTASSTTT
jgi:alpha-glucuronidase